jgi:hypothetical protein
MAARQTASWFGRKEENPNALYRRPLRSLIGNGPYLEFSSIAHYFAGAG